MPERTPLRWLGRLIRWYWQQWLRVHASADVPDTRREDKPPR